MQDDQEYLFSDLKKSQTGKFKCRSMRNILEKGIENGQSRRLCKKNIKEGKYAIFIPNNQGALPLHLGAAHLSPDIFKQYLSKTCDPSIPDHQGETPLFYILNSRGDHALINF